MLVPPLYGPEGDVANSADDEVFPAGLISGSSGTVGRVVRLGRYQEGSHEAPGGTQ